MRWWFITLIYIAATLSAMSASANTIPTSVLSRTVIERNRSFLEKDLKLKGFKWGAPLFIRIFKVQKFLEVWLYDHQRFRFFKRFKICTFGNKGLGPKRSVGDGFAPEGFYYVTPGQLNPYSRYHLAFNLGYPNTYDRQHGHTGSALMVHGACVSVGCFAMDDAQMEIIYALAEAAFRAGQPFFRVHIFPFPMTQQRIDSRCQKDRTESTQAQCQWYDFWENLKLGYDYFELHNRPPNVTVRNGRYVFGKDH